MKMLRLAIFFSFFDLNRFGHDDKKKENNEKEILSIDDQTKGRECKMGNEN